MSAMHIRWMLRHDIPPVLVIASAVFEEAWTEDDFLRALRQRNCIGMVVERGNDIIGFMVYELHRDHIMLATFAVHPNFHRTGVGSAMIAKMIYKLCSHRRERLVLDVHETNTAAHLFFRAMGFRATGVRGADYRFEYVPTADEYAEFGGAPVNRLAEYKEW